MRSNSRLARPQAVVGAATLATASCADAAQAALAFGALSQTTRLGILRMLVRQGPVGMDADEMAWIVGGPRSTLSQHLAGLSRVGLIIGARTDLGVRYRAWPAGIHGLLAFLLEDCCAARPGDC